MTDDNFNILISLFREFKQDMKDEFGELKDELRVRDELVNSLRNNIQLLSEKLTIYDEKLDKKVDSIELSLKEVKISYEVLEHNYKKLKEDIDKLYGKYFELQKRSFGIGETNQSLLEELNTLREKQVEYERKVESYSRFPELLEYFEANKVYTNYFIKVIMFIRKYRNNIWNKVKLILFNVIQSAFFKFLIFILTALFGIEFINKLTGS